MSQLNVQPGDYVAIETELKSTARYKKARVVQVSANQITLDTRERYDLEGFPLAKDGSRKQVTIGVGTLLPLTPELEQLIEHQDLAQGLGNTPWILLPDDVLHEVKGLLEKRGLWQR